MKLSGTRAVAASPEAVWMALNDLDVLRRSLPGCERLDRLDDERIATTVTARIGPIAATFAGMLRLHDVDPPHGCRIEGEGESAAAGFARGDAIVRLSPDGGGTRLDYQVEARVGGKLAQLGARIVDGAARKTADDFFARFAAEVERPPEAAAAPAAVEEERRPSLPALVWVPGIVALVIAILLAVDGL